MRHISCSIQKFTSSHEVVIVHKRLVQIQGQERAFSDASTVGNIACAYVRVVFAQCYLLMEKSGVAPLKRVFIPRSELVAAMLAIKTSTMICREVDITLSKVYF